LVAAKRAMDILLAAGGLLVASPVMALLCVVIKLTSPGPIFYHQARVGQNGRGFSVHKFRSMLVNAEAGTGAVWAQSNDPRITWIGRIIRKTRFDELPQLWNVLVGDMSLVGPRPERPEFVTQLTDEIPFYGQRHVVKPGVTGWAQVRYAYGASVRDSLEKLQYDLFYIKHMSLAFDTYILFETMKTVVLRRGAA
jgi:exopolysaccharide biosynthesis polyprenyl glycosylphosphotransferase